MQSAVAPPFLPSQPGHFLTLDALRGVAALAVLILHMPPLTGLVFHAYLAVDLFFIMSGFVVAHAYEHRLLAGWSLSDFIRTRVIRLWPLYLLGTAIGAAVFAGVAGDAAGFAALGVLFAAALVMLPLPLGADVQIFNLNRPAWSLFFEMVANILYAAFAPRLSNRVLVGIVGIGALAVTAAFLTAGSGSLGHHGASMLGGAARITFAFPLGLLLHRLWSAGRLMFNVPALAVIGAVAALFFLPDVPGWNGVIDLAVVLLAFPLLTTAAVNATLSPRLARAAGGLALLSYPLYILHGPIIMGAGQMLGETPAAAFIGGGVSLILAWAAGRWFDGPARVALASLLRQRRAAVTAA